MVAHGLPNMALAPSTRPLELLSATDDEYVVSTTTNLVDTVSKIAKEAGEMLKDVPYVKALAGIIVQIIKIREVRALIIMFWVDTDDRCRKSKWQRIIRRN